MIDDQPPPRPRTGAERMAKLREKKAKKNLEQIAVWVPAKKLAHLRKESLRSGLSLSQLISERL